MTPSIVFSRRGLLTSVGASLVGFVAGFPGAAFGLESDVRLSFAGKIPSGVVFRRPSPASYLSRHGRLGTATTDEPRYSAGGLLIEGDAINLLRFPQNLSRPGRRFRFGDIAVIWLPNEPAPDGSLGVLRIDRLGNQSMRQSIRPGHSTGVGPVGVYSVWLRAPNGSAPIRMGSVDGIAPDGIARPPEVGSTWQRFVTRAGRPGGAGNGLFSAAADLLSSLRELSDGDWFGSLYAWGAQYEYGAEASSLMLAGSGEMRRAADEVTLSTKRLLEDTRQGRLTLHLPDGGRPDGIILDSSRGERNGIRLSYSPGGLINARVGRMDAAGPCNVAQDKTIELTWHRSGIQIATGESIDDLVVRSRVSGNPLPVECGDMLRLGMSMDGRRPLNRPLAWATFGGQIIDIDAPQAPIFISSKYELVFGDEFDDPDVTRINEGATGGRPGSPAWRSRYRWDRHTIINEEKQIYMDPDFAGTAPRALKVQPFSIADGVLRIRADRADPVRVSPFIWNYQYTSGCITSELTHWQKYGYFEMSARLPLGRGFWPAFWLMPKRQGWPPEIDVFECSGQRRTSVHQGALQAKRAAYLGEPGVWIDGMVDISDSFHSYALEWTEKWLHFFLDGKKTLEVPNVSINEDMYLIANLAIGSSNENWIPNPDASTPFPSFFEIEYIRAFSRQ